MKPLLLIGYGNPGRGDDGLGPALVARLEALQFSGLELISDYQLSLDMAYDVARFHRVVFADAAITGPEPYSYSPLQPGAPISFSSHSQSPEGVLCMSQTLFDGSASAYLLGIRGYRFGEFCEELSPQAERNLQAALDFAIDQLLPG